MSSSSSDSSEDDDGSQNAEDGGGALQYEADVEDVGGPAAQNHKACQVDAEELQ